MRGTRAVIALAIAVTAASLGFAIGEARAPQGADAATLRAARAVQVQDKQLAGRIAALTATLHGDLRDSGTGITAGSSLRDLRQGLVAPGASLTDRVHDDLRQLCRALTYNDVNARIQCPGA